MPLVGQEAAGSGDEQLALVLCVTVCQLKTETDAKRERCPGLSLGHMAVSWESVERGGHTRVCTQEPVAVCWCQGETGLEVSGDISLRGPC